MFKINKNHFVTPKTLHKQPQCKPIQFKNFTSGMLSLKTFPSTKGNTCNITKALTPSNHYFSYSPRFCSTTVKDATGVAGVSVEPKWKEQLIGLYQQIQRDLTIMPEGPYKDMVTKTTNFRLSIVEKHSEYEPVEAEIGCGQVEELMSQAKDELKLIPIMALEKPWIIPENQAPAVLVVEPPFFRQTYAPPPGIVKT